MKGGWVVWWMVGWMVGWITGWVTGWVVWWMVGWMVGWMTGRLYRWIPALPPGAPPDVRGGALPRPRLPGHRQAPAGLSMELYHADTGRLLCAHYPTYGKSREVRIHDIPCNTTPCHTRCLMSWGTWPAPPACGAVRGRASCHPSSPPFHANLTSAKRNNNTFAHLGEMASWQMRAVLANLPV